MKSDPQLADVLAALRKKYKPMVDVWFRKNDANHKMFESFTHIRLTLESKVESLCWTHISMLKHNLEKLIPDDRFYPKTSISLDSDSEDERIQNNNNEKNEELLPLFNVSPIKIKSRTPRKRPQNQKSIGIYSIKTMRLPPSSIFAEPSEKNKKDPPKIMNCNYVPNGRIPDRLTPEQEEEKLKRVREKIYLKISAGIFKDNDHTPENRESKDKAKKSMHNLGENSSQAKRRKSCYEPVLESKDPDFMPSFAIKRTRRKSLFKSPAKIKSNHKVKKPSVSKRRITARARKELNDTKMEKTLPKPPTDYEMDVEEKQFFDMLPSP